jgi:hypothetical protein
MCNLFFDEFQVVPSVNVFKLFCVLLYTTEVEGWMNDPDRRLDQLSRRRGAGAHNLFYD